MKNVIYWEKVPVFNKKKRETTFELVATKAKVVGDSELICGVCHEREMNHNRRRPKHTRQRKHTFVDPIGGLTLEITNDDTTYTMKNVQEGKKACHWTEKE